MENLIEIVQQQAADALTKLDAQIVVSAETVAESVLNQSVYWEKLLPSGERLMFVRLFSPVVQREEVFLGNILFNAFLHKAFARAIVEGKLGVAELVANDLESYYFLVRTTKGASRLADAFRVEVEHSLPDLFFGEQDEARGVYGSVETMLAFEKANVEPFPIFIMPKIHEARLEQAVRVSLLSKIEKSLLEKNPTSIMANLAFFYSHDGTEMQSPYLFLARLWWLYEIIDGVMLQQALNRKPNVKLVNRIAGHLRNLKDECDREQDAQKKKALSTDLARKESAVKQFIEESLKQKEKHSFSSANLRELLKQAIVNLGERVDSNPNAWRMPYISEKFLTHDEKALTDVLLGGVSVGYVAVASLKKAIDVGCRVCGTLPMEAEDKSILMGQNTHKFHNQSVKQKNESEPKTCLRCAVSTYLMVKLLGSEAVGQPQVPKSYNLIFHYGKHDDAQVEELARKVELIWGRVTAHQQKESDVSSIRKAIRELERKLEEQEKEQKKQDKLSEQKQEQKIQELETQLQAKQAELPQAESSLANSTDDLFSVCPWLAGSATTTHDIPSLDILSNSLSRTKVEQHILGLGLGGYRMILFVLPQIRKPQDAKERDFAQSRFSNSRVTVTTLLSFLRQVCGCDGPFYYQSLPSLAPDAFERGTFYIRNQPISAKQAQDEYEVVTQLAWKLVRQWGSKGFVEKVVLAEKLLDDPLGTFASVMRDSPILGVKYDAKKKRQPRKLHGDYRRDWQAQDLTEYARFIQKLSKLQEVK